MTNFRTAMIAAVAAAAMVGSQALAADVSLAPGKPAGVQQAQRHHGPNLWLIGGAAVVAVVAVVVATQSNSYTPCSTACSSPTTTS
jgi:hypothetical protein